MEQNRIEAILHSLPDIGLAKTSKKNELVAAIAATLKTLPWLIPYIKAALTLIEEFDPKNLPNNFESGGIATNDHSEGGEYIMPAHKKFSGTMQPDPNIPPVKGILDIIKDEVNETPMKFTLNGNVLSIFDNDFPYTIQRGYIKRCIKQEACNVTILLECDFFPNSGGIRTFKISDERTYFYCSEAAEKALPVIICTKQENDETNTPEH